MFLYLFFVLRCGVRWIWCCILKGLGCRALFCLFVGLSRRILIEITILIKIFERRTCAVLRRRMQMVAKMEVFATYSIIRTWRGENQLLSDKTWLRIYQNVLREKIVGSQIDNSHACPFPPSSANVGVAGRKVCLKLDTLHSVLRQRRKESRGICHRWINRNSPRMRRRRFRLQSISIAKQDTLGFALNMR